MSERPLQPARTARVLRLLAGTTAKRWLRAFHIAQAARSAKRSQGKPRRAGKLALLFLLLLPFLILQPLLLSSQAVGGLVDAVSVGEGDVRLPVSRMLYELLRAEHRRHGSDRNALHERLERWISRSGHDVERVLTQLVEYGPAGFRAYERNDILPDPGAWPSAGPQHERLLRALSVLVSLMVLALACAAIGANPQLGRGEWSLNWLLGFPVDTRAIVTARALEYGLVQVTPWLTLCPFLIVVHYAAGHGAWGIAYAMLATASLAMVIGALRLLGETWLRLNLSVQRLRGIQGLSALVTTLMFFALVAGAAQRPLAEWFSAPLLGAPDLVRNLPTAWPVSLIERPLVGAGLCLALALIAMGLAIEVTTWLLRHGTTRSDGAAPQARGSARWHRAAGTFRGLLGKELRLLLRDRNFLVSTLVVPVVMIGLQLFLNRRVGRLSSGSGQWHATAAYVVGAYSLTTGCFRVLAGEGRALWLLFAQPVDIAAALRRKVAMWAGLGLTFGLGTLFALTATRGAPSFLALLSDVLFVAAGIWIASHLAAGIAALAANPAIDHVRPNIGARFSYLYLFLAATYTAGLQSPLLTTRITALVVLGTAVAALWLRVRDRLPYLLDPEPPPERNLSLYDAALAALVFFVAQMLAGLLLADASDLHDERALAALMLQSFVIAGALTLALFGLLLGLRGVNLSRAFALAPDSWPRALLGCLLGALLGAGLGLLGNLYGELAQQLGWIDSAAATPNPELFALLALAVVAAPLCEEAIFRGLLFQSMQSALGTKIAVPWSAAVFAAVHPPVSWPPVFALGCLCASLVTHARFLPAAIVAHAAYNAVVVLRVGV